MSFFPSKAYLMHCLQFFYDKRLIVDNLLHKEAARKDYKEKCIRENTSQHNFTSVLLGWNRYNFCSQKGGEYIQFTQSALNQICRSQDSLNHVIKKKTRGSNSKATKNYCKLCNMKFSEERGYQKHIETNQNHIFRQHYSVKSKLLTSSGKTISVRLNKERHTTQETLVLQKDVASNTRLFLTNKTKHAYIITDIIALHEQTQECVLERVKLPVALNPSMELSLNIASCFNTSNSRRFVYVFVATNLMMQKVEYILKEINVEIISKDFSGLLPTEPYSKPKPIKNDISMSDFVPCDASRVAMHDAIVVPFKIYNVPGVVQRILKAGLKPYKGMTPNERCRLNETQQLLNSSSRKMNKNNYYELFKLLLYMEDLQMSKDIRNYDSQSSDIVRCKGYQNRFQLKVAELAENRPSLLPGDFVYIKERGGEAFQGLVTDIREDSVVLTFNKRFGSDVYKNKKLFSITYGCNRNNIRAEHRAIELIDKRKATAHFFPKHPGKTALKNYNVTWFNGNMQNNDEQQKAVLHVLSKTAYPAPYLIFGPPGTGKTMTIVEAISQVWKHKPDDKILVCAPSNSVANEIACRLVKYIPHSDLFRYIAYSFQLREVPKDILPCVNYDDGEYFHPTHHDLLQYRIVIATLSTASRLVTFGVPSSHFSYVFIDESGHATETETLIPVSLLTTMENKGFLSGQVVLAGDPQQLGPVIHSALAKQYGLGQSMLERLMTTLDLYKKDNRGGFNSLVLTKLLYNYRSHPAILNVPNKLFYENELVPKGNDQINIAVNWRHLPNPKIPIVFHSIVGTDQREKNSPSYFNVQEVELVINYLSALIGTHLKKTLISEDHIGVIAPYRKQVQKIREACSRKKWNKVMVGSVEQFQGQEKLIVIISTVRSQPQLLQYDNKFHLGFLNNPKRFNVAVTRAKALLIVIGNPNLLQHEKYWKDFIKYCMDKKCFTGKSFVFDNVENINLRLAKLTLTDDTDDAATFARGNV